MAYLLRKYRSPQQIARTLKGMFPDDAQRQASHEAIYNALYAVVVKESVASEPALFMRALAEWIFSPRCQHRPTGTAVGSMRTRCHMQKSANSRSIYSLKE